MDVDCTFLLLPVDAQHTTKRTYEPRPEALGEGEGDGYLLVTVRPVDPTYAARQSRFLVLQAQIAEGQAWLERIYSQRAFAMNLGYYAAQGIIDLTVRRMVWKTDEQGAHHAISPTALQEHGW